MDTSRRAFLASATAATAGLAGCVGGIAGGSGGGCGGGSEPKVDSLPNPKLGDADAPVLLETYEDFSCPHCATFSQQVAPKIVSNFVEPGDVRWAFNDFPIPVSQKWSWAAASAARGVQDEADDATFFEYVKKLFENQQQYSMDLVQSLADEVGVDGCAIGTDATNETYRPVVEADRQEGIDRGVDSTPFVFVNRQPVASPAYRDVEAAIRSHLG